MKYTKVLPILAMMSMATISCNDSFIDRPTRDGTTVETYYTTAAEVRAATSTLYGLPWHGFESRSLTAIGDIMSGNAHVGSGNPEDYPFLSFTISAAAPRLQEAWGTFYKIGGWTSSLIKVFEEKKAMGGDASFIDPAIAECHFLKGTVYFYIARIWGDAPIVNDPAQIALSGNFNIPKYLQKDVLRFALEELKLAEAGLPETDEPGRVTTYSAKGMMAKLYLYMKDYENAKIKALEVINSDKYSLYPDYATLFTSSSAENSAESLFATQRIATSNPWGSGNHMGPDRGPAVLGTDETGMWGSYIPTLSILAEYGQNNVRKTGSVMTHGWSKPQWKPMNGNPSHDAFMAANGFVYDTTHVAVTNQYGTRNGTLSNMAKYVVGPGSKYGGEPIAGGQASGINTMLLRYADILLIYAEAVIGDGESTTDPTAIGYVNEVRDRAGVDLIEGILTKEQLFQERRLEFAFEGDYWFDLQRMGFEKAKKLVEAQNRGTIDEPNFVTPTWKEQKDMFLPIPVGETLQDPELLKNAVSYYND